MTAHECKVPTDGCYRCELNKDEIAAFRAEDEADASAAWLNYRDAQIAERSWADPRRVIRQLRRGSFIAGFIAGRQS
jgi:hypothetical protein